MGAGIWTQIPTLEQWSHQMSVIYLSYIHCACFMYVLWTYLPHSLLSPSHVSMIFQNYSWKANSPFFLSVLLGAHVVKESRTEIIWLDSDRSPRALHKILPHDITSCHSPGAVLQNQAGNRWKWDDVPGFIVQRKSPILAHSRQWVQFQPKTEMKRNLHQPCRLKHKKLPVLQFG